MLKASLLVTLGLVVGFGAGLFWKSVFSQPGHGVEHRLSGYQFISPLLECDLWTPGEIKNLRALEQSIRDVISQAKASKKVSQVSVYFRDLHNGPWVGLDEQAAFSAASLLKVPVLIAFFEMSRRDPDLPFRPVRFESPTTPFRQNVIPERHLEHGKTYAAEELARRMIVYSDNDAMQLLLNVLGEEKVQQTLKRLGVNESHLWAPDSVTVKEYAGFFRVLYNASVLDRDASEKALSWLSQVEYREGLVKYLPEQLWVAHKFGERDFGGAHQLHDCGIVYAPQRPYLLCVMTRGTDRTQLSAVIAEVSKVVFEHFERSSASVSEAKGDVEERFDFSFKN